jgi:FdhD protein
VQTAQAANITLAALIRDDTFEIFTHPQRITSTETIDVA